MHHGEDGEEAPTFSPAVLYMQMRVWSWPAYRAVWFMRDPENDQRSGGPTQGRASVGEGLLAAMLPSLSVPAMTLLGLFPGVSSKGPDNPQGLVTSVIIDSKCWCETVKYLGFTGRQEMV